MVEKFYGNEMHFVTASIGTFSLPLSNNCFENVADDASCCRCTIVFKKNGPTRGGNKRKFLREVHKSKLNAFESNAILRCLLRLML